MTPTIQPSQRIATPDGRSLDLWLADHVANACPHLLEGHGHLTLIVDTFPQILDELVAGEA